MQSYKNEIIKLCETYMKLLEKQQFDKQGLDYTILKKHNPALRMLAEKSNSFITVFDVFQKKHVFHSSNFEAFLGYAKKDFEDEEAYILNSKIHPEDYLLLLKNRVTLFQLLTNIPVNLKLNCKLINEFRILNAANQFIKVIEQQQVLELDNKGNVWLALSILDISPNQNVNETLKAQILNFKTGEFVNLLRSKDNKGIALTKREIEILKHVKEGKLSKEISDKLYISVHTVNTHRQKILRKLSVNNSMEAIKIAADLGLI